MTLYYTGTPQRTKINSAAERRERGSTVHKERGERDGGRATGSWREGFGCGQEPSGGEVWWVAYRDPSGELSRGSDALGADGSSTGPTHFVTPTECTGQGGVSSARQCHLDIRVRGPKGSSVASCSRGLHHTPYRCPGPRTPPPCGLVESPPLNTMARAKSGCQRTSFCRCHTADRGEGR